jgi:tetratricopeptide (TPR) repeat protein
MTTTEAVTWMGCETEFGHLGGHSLEKANAIQNEVASRHESLPSIKSGLFLANGGRVYVDQGKQNEYATPEVDSPRELVRRELAGRLLMQESARACGLTLLCSNSDPRRKTAWGAHENYACNRWLDDGDYHPLFAHLCSRILYSGGGGRDPWSAFPGPVLSARACHIRAARSEQGIARKALVFGKPEHHGSAQRLHVTAGETLLSHTASWLKYATTALVVAAIDQRLALPDLRFRIDPVRALRRINRDVSLSTRIPMLDGRRLTALEMQRLLLEGLSRHLDHFPAWAADALLDWSAALDDVEQVTPRALRRFDWIIHSRLMKSRSLIGLLRQVSYAGFSGQELANFAPEHAIAELRAGNRAPASDLLYTWLHVVGPNSLFNRLEAAGELDHSLAGMDEEHIAAAKTSPPPGRAEMRAAMIRRKAEFPDGALSWGYFRDLQQQRHLDLPFVASAGWDTRWRELTASQAAREAIANHPIILAEHTFRSGHFHKTLEHLGCRLSTTPRNLSSSSLETAALAAARCGQVALCEELLGGAAGFTSSRLDRLGLELACRVHQGFAPDPGRLMPTVREGLPLVRDMDNPDYIAMVFLQYAGWVLVADGHLAEAETIFRKLLAAHERDWRIRTPARTACYLGELLRRQGRMEDARELCGKALDAHRREKLKGDAALHSLPLAARLFGTDPEVRETLALARMEAIDTANDFALARVLCLKARCLRTAEDRDQIFHLLETQSALVSCPVALRILANWDEWIAGPGEGSVPDFWNL